MAEATLDYILLSL